MDATQCGGLSNSTTLVHSGGNVLRSCILLPPLPPPIPSSAASADDRTVEFVFPSDDDSILSAAVADADAAALLGGFYRARFQ